MASSSTGEDGPPRDGCETETDVGKLYQAVGQDIWYECIFDRSRAGYTWAILPPTD